MNHGALDTFIFRFSAAMVADGTLAHTLHTYKEIDLETGERPDMQRPFIFIDNGRSSNPNQPKANTYQQPFRDLTRVLVYIETELSFTEGSKLKGGYDLRHKPAINFVSNFIRDNRSLTIPIELLTDFGEGQIAVNPDNPAENHASLKDGSRSVFNAVLSFFTTTNDGLEAT